MKNSTLDEFSPECDTMGLVLPTPLQKMVLLQSEWKGFFHPGERKNTKFENITFLMHVNGKNHSISDLYKLDQKMLT